MKTKICTALAVAAMISLSAVNVYADENTALIASETAGYSIENNFSEEDIEYYDFLFGTSDVKIEFENAAPYYIFNNNSQYENISDTYSFSGSYYVPVKSSGGDFLCYAEYRQNGGVWEIVSTAAGDYYDELYSVTSGVSLYSDHSSAMLTGDGLFNDVGVVLDNDYFDFTSYFNNISARNSISDYIINGNEKVQQMLSEPVFEGEGGAGGNGETEEPNPKTGNNGFPAAAVAACALAAVSELIICRKK